MPYDHTTVKVSASQEGIRRLLKHQGAERFSFAEGLKDGRQWVGVEFVHARHLVRMTVPLKLADEMALRGKARRSRRSLAEITVTAYEQEAQRTWRVLHWSIKARLEAVTEGVETFEQAFLAHLVEPSTGATVWEIVHPQIEAGALSLGGGSGRLALSIGGGR